jgi:ribosomal protein S18 acetylase RimI-like enzyme
MQKPAHIVTVRPATPDDEAFLFQLFVVNRPELSLLNLEESQKQALIKMQFDAQRQQYDSCYPQAESGIILSDGRAIGRLLVDRRERDIVLIDIAMMPEHQNRGIGTGVIRKLLGDAADAGKAVRLHVLKSNPALRLYERLGFYRVEDQSMYFEMMCEPTQAGH